MKADPLARLSELHRQIETSLALLMRLAARARTEALIEEERTSLEKALDFFRRIVPQHAADEEEIIFPRLRREKAGALLPVLARLESLEEEHVCADRMQTEIEALCAAWLRQGTLSETAASRLAKLLGAVHGMYRHHIAVEEDEIFPAAASTFSESTLRAVVREMARRRGESTAG